MGPFPHDAPKAAISAENPAGTDGFEFVEFAHPEPEELRALFTRMGFALVEELVWDGARLANPSMMDYKIPTMAELPATLRAYLVESDEPSGPFGAKSVGEIGINGVAAAIANAVNDAVGVRLRRLPMTAERVLDAMLDEGRAAGQ